MSEETETEMYDSWEKAQAKMREAELASKQGNSYLALKLANEAISIAEDGGNDPYLFKIDREMMLVNGSKEPDFSGVITVMQETLATYGQENSYLPQIIDLLINLVGLLINQGNKPNALYYLDQAEELLKNTTSDEISQHLPRNRLLTGSTFISFKLADVDRLRKHIEGTESS